MIAATTGRPTRPPPTWTTTATTPIYAATTTIYTATTIPVWPRACALSKPHRLCCVCAGPARIRATPAIPAAATTYRIYWTTSSWVLSSGTSTRGLHSASPRQRYTASRRYSLPRTPHGTTIRPAWATSSPAARPIAPATSTTSAAGRTYASC